MAATVNSSFAGGRMAAQRCVIVAARTNDGARAGKKGTGAATTEEESVKGGRGELSRGSHCR